MDKSTMKKLFRSAAVCTLSATMLFAGSCGRPEQKREKIAVITKQDISFWADVESGAKDAGKELGFDIIYNVATSDNDYASQIEFINNAIKDDVDAIVIAPNSSDTELNEAFAKAEAAGIKLININSRANYDGIISCVSSSDLDGGSVAARHSAASVLGADDLRAVFSSSAEKKPTLEAVQEYGKGAIAILGHTAQTANDRIKGYKSECIEQILTQMAADGLSVDNGGKQLTDEQKEAMFQPFFIECNRCSTIDASYEEAKKILTGADGKNIRTFYATNTNTTLGVCKAVEELGLSDKIFVVGFNSDEQEINYLRNRVLDGLVVQNPYSIGYVGVSYARKALNGQRLPKSLDTGVTFVNSDNLNDDYVQLLLHPDTY
jgi:ribose transport system substrate-binding protein